MPKKIYKTVSLKKGDCQKLRLPLKIKRSIFQTNSPTGIGFMTIKLDNQVA